MKKVLLPRPDIRAVVECLHQFRPVTGTQVVTGCQHSSAGYRQDRYNFLCPEVPRSVGKEIRWLGSNLGHGAAVKYKHLLYPVFLVTNMHAQFKFITLVFQSEMWYISTHMCYPIFQVQAKLPECFPRYRKSVLSTCTVATQIWHLQNTLEAVPHLPILCSADPTVFFQM